MLSEQRVLSSFGPDKRYLYLVNGCFEYHPPIISNVCPPKQSQNSLRRKLIPIPLIVSGVWNKVGYALDPYTDWLPIVIDNWDTEKPRE